MFSAPSSACLQPLESRCLLSIAPLGGSIDGIGVLGDSYSDEYQFYSPDRSTAQNWIEQLAESSNANFGTFSSVDPPGPQNAGYGYNWAVSGATSTDMTAGGQLAGLLPQVMSGEVDLVTIFIGGNDFRDVFSVLATQGPEAAGAALQAAVPTLLTNIGTAAGTILSAPVVAANPDVHLELATIPKLSYLPEVRAAVAAMPAISPFVDAVDGAVQVVNQLIQQIAAGNNRIVVADFAGMMDKLFAQTKLKVGNAELNCDALFNPTNDPTYLMLGDLRHPGTLVQGLMANLFVDTANKAFGTQIKRLTTHEILQDAGLKKENAPPAFGPASAQSTLFSTGSVISKKNDLLG